MLVTSCLSATRSSPERDRHCKEVPGAASSPCVAGMPKTGDSEGFAASWALRLLLLPYLCAGVPLQAPLQPAAPAPHEHGHDHAHALVAAAEGNLGKCAKCPHHSDVVGAAAGLLIRVFQTHACDGGWAHSQGGTRRVYSPPATASRFHPLRMLPSQAPPAPRKTAAPGWAAK